MYYAESNAFFEISNGPQLENNFQSKMLCLKDFLKRCAVFPFALVLKACKTIFRVLGLCFSAILLLITMGMAREIFIARISVFARDLSTGFFCRWLLLAVFLG